MAMLFSEWLRKEEEKKKSSSNTSAPSSQPVSAQKETGSTPASSGSNSGSKKTFSQWLNEQEAKGSASDWAKRSNTLLNDMQSYYSTWRVDNKDQYERFQTEASKLLSGADSWRKQYAGDEKAISTINSIVDALSKGRQAAKQYRDVYSQYKTEAAYKSAVAQQKDYDEKSKYDTVAGQKEIEELESVLREYLGYIGAPSENRQARMAEIERQYGDVYKLDDLINEKQAYLNQAKHIQKGITLSGAVNNADFGAYSGYVSTKSDDLWSQMWSQYGLGHDDLTYEYINNQNGMRDKINQKQRVFSSDNPFDDGENSFEAKGYDHLTPEEVAVYNYYYAKEGKDKAEEYLDSIQETLNMRKANAMFENIKGNTAFELASGVVTGLDQFKTGVHNLFNTEDDYIPTSSYQMMSGMVREDLADDGLKLPDWLGGASLGQAAFDTITTTTNMVPSIMTSVAVGVINPAAGTVAGTTLMSASAAGHAYQEALNLGYDKGQARTYSTLVGASEGVLQYLLGGIGALGGKLTGGALSKIMSGVDNAFARVAIQLGGNMLSEGVEEGLQEILTPWFEHLILNADANVNWNEVAYSSLLGALTGGIMEGGGTISNAISTSSEAKRIYGESQSELVNDALAVNPDNVLAQKLRKRLDNGKSASGTQLAMLAEQNDATMIEQDTAAIQEATAARLTELGETGDIDAISKALTKQAKGEKLSRSEQQTIANSKYGQRVANELNPENINSGEYTTEWAQKIDTNKINADEYGRLVEAAQLEQDAQEATEGNFTAEVPNVAQDSAEAAQSVTETVAENATVQQEDGATIYGDEEVNIAAVRSAKNGRMTLELADGRVVSADSVSYASEGTTLVYNTVQEVASDPRTANVMVNGFKDGMNAETYTRGILLAHMYGKNNLPIAELLQSGSVAKLPASVRSAAYKAGQVAGGRETARAQAAANKAKKPAGTVGRVLYADGAENLRDYVKRSGIKLNDQQEAGVLTMEKMSAALGVDFYVYESYLNKDGNRVYINEKGNEVSAPNGYYVNGKVYVDLNAGASGKGTMLFTVAHELTHHIKVWSPAKFKVLANYVVEQYAAHGQDVSALVARQIEKVKNHGRTLDYDDAFEEVVADSMEGILADGNVLQMMADIKKQDKSLWQKICDWFKNLAEELKSIVAAYTGYTPDSVEGRMVADMQDVIGQIEKLYAEALVDTTNLSPDKEGVTTNANGDPVAYSTGDGTLMLSMRTYEEEGRTALKKYLEKCVSSKKLTKAEMQEMTDGIEEIYETCKKFKDKYAPFSSWSDAAVIRDTRGKPVFSVVTPNGEYKMNLDFSLVCKKRRTLDAVFNEMSKRGIIDDFELGQKSVVKINEIIRKYGLETACALCFVDAKRFRQASMADSFVNLYNELVESLVPEDQHNLIDRFNFSGYQNVKTVENGIDTWDNSKLDFSHLNHVMKTYGEGTVESKAAKYLRAHREGRKLLLRGDFMSSSGFDAVKSQNPDVLKLYNSKKGTGGPKAAFGDVQYMNEIIQKARWWTPAKAYEVGGVRIQSFSDYVPRMVFDYVQMVYDLAATELPAHAYTKEALFVKQFGLTGIKINMSLIPAIAEGGIAPGLDANGNYVWAGESFDFETAKEIQKAEGYTENCGTICVGVSKAHILKLLSDPDIRMVIPYHKSGLNPIVAHMNKIAEFTDYTSLATNPGGCQNTMDKNGSKVTTDFNFNKVLKATGDPKATVKQYLGWCAKHEYTPRFAEFAWHENYYKLIEDFTLYDANGQYVPQREVRAVFPTKDSAFGSMKDLIREGLEEDAIVEGKRDERLSAIVDEIERTLPKTETEIAEDQVEQADRDLEADVKYSARGPKWKPNLDDTEWGIVKYTIDNNQGAAITSTCNMFFKKSMGKTLFGIYSTDDSTLLYASRNRTAEEEHALVDLLREEYQNGDVADTSAEGLRAWAEAVRMQRVANNNHGPGDVASGRFEGNAELHGGSLRFHASAALRNVLANIFEEGRTADGHPLNRGSGASALSVAFDSNQVKSVANKKPTADPDIRYQERPAVSVSNRALLDKALEETATDAEKPKLRKYKATAKLIEKEEAKLRAVNDQIRALNSAKSAGYTTAIKKLRAESEPILNNISTYNQRLLRLEASEQLKSVLAREKEAAYQAASKEGDEALADFWSKSVDTDRRLRDAKQRYWESRRKGVQNRRRTEMRHKIKDVVNELNQYLLKGTKDKHVMIELQKAVAEALDVVNMDTVSAASRVTELQKELGKVTRKLDKTVDEAQKAELYKKIQEISEKINRVQSMGDKMDAKLQKFHAAYADIINSDDPLIANSHDEGIEGKIKEVAQKVGKTPLRDMTFKQLEDVYDLYKMVLHTIREANKSFKYDKNESISVLANNVMMEVEEVGGKKKYRLPGTKGLSQLDWNNLKPVYAFSRIGSNTLSKVFDNVRAGEDVWAKDVSEAREYYLEKTKKYGYDNWDFEKPYEFESASGMKFSLTLDQIMSLYAYSKRGDQARDHLRYGGFVFDPKTEVVVKTKRGLKVKMELTDATAYNISDETFAEILSKLKKEQTDFVDEMQEYLSSTMSEKGNEVSLVMYGVKLFKEKNYFPLKSATQYMAKAKEQAQGEVKIKNSGFTKETTPKAKNPIVLSSFMDVWANHINEMSMYHAFVLPMEDFYRVYNYTTPNKNPNLPEEGVNPAIQNAYGNAATDYIEQLLKDLNGGARTDSTTGFINKAMGLFKKGSVFASLSVVVQQPSAIARATALVDTRYFIGPKVTHSKHKELWAEVKKYAPVAIIKEMGYFDTNMGKSTADFITAKEYSGVKEKMKALVKDGNYRDEVLSKAPALADELAWCGIWEAVKREVKDKNKDIDVKSEEFLRKVGERFTEVIVKTQVYDSVLSRSALMRSKDTGMKMATAFMAEPTTAFNMIEDALVYGKRGFKRRAARSIGAVVTANILNAILVSFVYAGRDDDEDETYVEKYIGSFTGELMDGMNPATYIPFIKDIVSIAQGYDVERSDMAIVSDLWNAWNKLWRDDVDVYQKVEGFAGSVAQIFGLPVKNIMRDARGIYQTVESFIDGEQTTAAGIGHAIRGSLPSWMGGGDVPNHQQLYEAHLSGDKEQIARVEKRYKDQSDINTAIRKALRENDDRILKAATARFNGDFETYKSLFYEIKNEGKFDFDTIMAAINAELSKLKGDEDTGYEAPEWDNANESIYTADDYYKAVISGKTNMADNIRADLIAEKQGEGYLAHEAESSVASAFTSKVKNAYMDKSISSAESERFLVEYGGKDSGSATTEIEKWNFELQHGYSWSARARGYRLGNISEQDIVNAVMTVEGATAEEAHNYIDFLNLEMRNEDIEITASDASSYFKYAEPAGIGVDVYLDYKERASACKGVKDEYGNVISGTKKVEILSVIDSLPISGDQKDALYFANGWAQSRLYEAPWR